MRLHERFLFLIEDVEAAAERFEFQRAHPQVNLLRNGVHARPHRPAII